MKVQETVNIKMLGKITGFGDIFVSSKSVISFVTLYRIKINDNIVWKIFSESGLVHEVRDNNLAHVSMIYNMQTIGRKLQNSNQLTNHINQ